MRLGVWVRCRNGRRWLPMRLVAGSVLRSTGYVQVMLPGRQKRSMHRLVASAFCEGEANWLVVNHKNGVRADNRAENLEWVTHGENLKHAFRVLGARRSSKGKFGESHATSKAVVRIDPTTGERHRYGSGMDAVREGFDSGAISHCCAGRAKVHKGYRWEKAA
jgi:hypothetical protein